MVQPKKPLSTATLLRQADRAIRRADELRLIAHNSALKLSATMKTCEGLSIQSMKEVRNAITQMACHETATTALSTGRTSRECLEARHARRRIAAELHDNVAQLLALCEMRISELAGRYDGDPDIPEARSYLDQALEFIRTMMINLNCTNHQTDSLWTELQRTAAEMKHHGLKVSVSQHGVYPPFDEHCIRLLVPAVRELLFNVIKHAGVRTARVIMRASRRKVTVEVIDKGRGFQHGNAGQIGTFGLSTVRERLAVLGGELTITSAPCRGTRAKLAVLVKRTSNVIWGDDASMAASRTVTNGVSGSSVRLDNKITDTEDRLEAT